ncbi:unnamed protein product [Ectocarpus fasciculatus]
MWRNIVFRRTRNIVFLGNSWSTSTMGNSCLLSSCGPKILSLEDRCYNSHAIYPKIDISLQENCSVYWLLCASLLGSTSRLWRLLVGVQSFLTIIPTALRYYSYASPCRDTTRLHYQLWSLKSRTS